MRFLLSMLVTLVIPLAAVAQDIGLPRPATEAAAEPSESIPLHSPDADIRTRLAGLFAQMEGLRNVRAEVRGGVVQLSGTTLNVDDRRKAEQVASRVTGVVSVENNLTAEHRVERRLAPIIVKSEEIARDLITFLPVLLLAVSAFAGFWALGRVITRRTRLFKRMKQYSHSRIEAD